MNYQVVRGTVSFCIEDSLAPLSFTPYFFESAMCKKSLGRLSWCCALFFRQIAMTKKWRHTHRVPHEVEVVFGKLNLQARFHCYRTHDTSPMTTGIDYILSESPIGGSAYKVFYVPSTTHQAHTQSFYNRKMSTNFLPSRAKVNASTVIF